MFTNGRIEIGTLRVVAPRLNRAGRHAIELRLSHALGLIDPCPSGIPPSTILLVRRVTDPLPRRIGFRPSSRLFFRDWEHAVRYELERLYRSAARPARDGPVASVEAVVFCDEGEMLACLALDIRRGLVQERWWWRSVLRTVSHHKAGLNGHAAAAVLAERMLRHPQAAVAAIAWLADRSLAGEALLTLTSDQATKVLQSIASGYQLARVQLDPEPFFRYPTSLPVCSSPWQALHIPPGLGRERAALLGLSMDLQTRPGAVRTIDYQHRLNAWWQATSNEDEVPRESQSGQPDITATSSVTSGRKSDLLPVDPETSCRPDRHSDWPSAATWKSEGDWQKRSGKGKSRIRDHDHPQAEGMDEPLPTALREYVRNGGDCSGTDKSTPGEHRFTQERETSALIPSVGFPRQIQASHSTAPAPMISRNELTLLTRPSDQSAMDHTTEEAINTRISPLPVQPEGALDRSPKKMAPPATQPLANGASTKLGGVLYLINMMSVLDLPERFETGWRLASGVGAWGTLEALARQLLEDDDAYRLREDPLWSAIAHLDGRPAGQPPGFRLPSSRPRRWPDFELPPEWLKDLTELALVPLSRVCRGRIRATYPPLLAGWLSRVLPFITARLRLALRISPPASLAQALLLVPGTLYLTASNIDLVASIESISLAARMAGLDGDPGWVPVFGRFIRFHFE